MPAGAGSLGYHAAHVAASWRPEQLYGDP